MYYFIYFLLGKLNILYLHVHTHGYVTSFICKVGQVWAKLDQKSKYGLDK